jgi:cytochrome c553
MKTLISLIILSSMALADGATLYTSLGCYGCHGPTAMGDGGYPQLAGKKPEYLRKKLHQYRDNRVKTAKAFLMAPFANNLSDEQIEMFVEYLSQLKESEVRYDTDMTAPNDAYGGGGS